MEPLGAILLADSTFHHVEWITYEEAEFRSPPWLYPKTI